MLTFPAIDMAKTGQNIIVLRKQAGLLATLLGVKVDDILVLDTPNQVQLRA